MKTQPSRAGRNDPCPCGSKKKYKHCHGANQHSMGTGQKIALAILAVAVAGGLMLSVSSRAEPTGPATGVWSEEHGHYH